jgi:hypothetical protein
MACLNNRPKVLPDGDFFCEDISKQVNGYLRGRGTVKLSKLHGYVSRIVKLTLHKGVIGKPLLYFFNRTKKIS